MKLIPSEFFITSGKASSEVSELNAFDVALIKAGIGEQNLVAVSSVIPIGAKRIERTELDMGAVTHCVLSQMRGSEGEIISAGIAYVVSYLSRQSRRNLKLVTTYANDHR